MLTKSTVVRISSAWSAAEGISTITPTRSNPAAWARSANSAASVGVEIIGAITQTSVSLTRAARAMASSCRVSTPGERSVVR